MNVVATLSKIAAATFEGSWHNVRYLAVRQTLPWLGLPAWRTTPSTCRRRHSSTSPPTRASVQVFDGASRKPLFTYESRSIPSLKTGEMLVQMKLATICGSDLHTIKGDRIEPTPLVLGHEGVGTVIAMNGAHDACGLGTVSLGDTITWSIADSCGHCPSCVDYELPQKCSSLFKYGHASVNDGSGLNGCYASHILIRKGTHVTKIPPSLPLQVAAPANCALATVCNGLDIPFRKSDKTALVQGAGLLGLYACAVLKTRGFTTVFCTDINEVRLKLSEKFGATPLPPSTSADGVKSRKDLIMKAAPNGVDVIVEVAGVSSLVSEGLSVLRFGGHYALLGMVHPKSQLSSVTGEQIIRKCATLRGSHNYAPKHLDQAVEFLRDYHQQFPFKDLVSQPFGLQDLPAAVDEAMTMRYARVSIAP